jgi:PIN domain nuclease of toxin-antitoxin system
MSSVNWAEVLQKSLAHGVDIADLREAMEALGLVIVAFDSTLAERVARLWLTHKTLSLAD